ncbi:MAG: hypothetical protein EP338_07495 [Bacteroidetes bacterium]|nr:MAG: hypothetical protein EP338_07495 [Bacteroidota bacterium]
MSFTFSHPISDFLIREEFRSGQKRKLNRVFLVEHKTLGIFGVLKHHQKTKGQEHLQQFLRNEALHSFHFMGLPETLAFSETEQEILLVKSFQEGMALDLFWQQLKKRDRLSFLVSMLEKLLPLLCHLEERGVVHADIKPSNIIIQKNDDSFSISLIDFGMAFHPNDPGQRKLIFSLAYSPPELILQQLHLAGPHSDLFALGVSVYQLLEGKLPWHHPNPAIMTNLQLTHPLPDSPAIPKKIKAILHRCCAKETFPKPPQMLSKQELEQILQRGINQRYSSYDEMIHEIHSLDLHRESDAGIWNRLIKIFSKS